ncbi:hypothetical protein ACHAWF_001987 [Thalassiosira exigua]
MMNCGHDDQYLFRLTSTFGWDDAISLCESLVFGIEAAAAAASGRRRRRGRDDLCTEAEAEEEDDDDDDEG